jgi:hypothetical protein
VILQSNALGFQPIRQVPVQRGMEKGSGPWNRHTKLSGDVRRIMGVQASFPPPVLLQNYNTTYQSLVSASAWLPMLEILNPIFYVMFKAIRSLPNIIDQNRDEDEGFLKLLPTFASSSYSYAVTIILATLHLPKPYGKLDSTNTVS